VLSVGTVRTLALVVCVAGIAGMIVSSILNHNGAAVTFGLFSAVAVLCSMVAKAVAADTERRLGGGRPGGGDDPRAVGARDLDTLAELLERQVEVVIAAGAAEEPVRQLVGEAVRFGRTLGPAGEPTFASDAGRERRRSPHAGNV
jgi:hypothetical protein